MTTTEAPGSHTTEPAPVFEHLSVLDLFKVGIGPSSSHTVGPMRAASDFIQQASANGNLDNARRVQIDLFGSLGATGSGHGTDIAAMLGLSGYAPDTVETASIAPTIERIREREELVLAGTHAIPFNPGRDTIFRPLTMRPEHPNAMRLTLYDAAGEVIETAGYFDRRRLRHAPRRGRRADARARSTRASARDALPLHERRCAACALQVVRPLDRCKLMLEERSAPGASPSRRSRPCATSGRSCATASTPESQSTASCPAASRSSVAPRLGTTSARTRGRSPPQARRRPSRRHGVGQPLRPRGQRRERSGQPRRDRADQRRRRHHPGSHALLRPVRAQARVGCGWAALGSAIPRRQQARSASSSSRTRQSREPRSAARARSGQPVRWQRQASPT